MTRACGDCQLCCKLVPVPPLGKLAGQRCRHQRVHKGCAVYRRQGMPMECALWSCRWLVENDTQTLSRPDRSHCVIDIMPDFVTLRDNETGDKRAIEVVQIWVDPDYPDAWREPSIKAYIERRAIEDGAASLIRFDNARALAVFAPAISSDRQWHEVESGMTEQAHSAAEVVEALGPGFVEVKLQATTP
jgi:hypothetical protein